MLEARDELHRTPMAGQELEIRLKARVLGSLSSNWTFVEAMSRKRALKGAPEGDDGEGLQS